MPTAWIQSNTTPRSSEKVFWKALFWLSSHFPLIPGTPWAEFPYNLERKWFSSAWKDYVWPEQINLGPSHSLMLKWLSLPFLAKFWGVEINRHRAHGIDGGVDRALRGQGSSGLRNATLPRHHIGLWWLASSWQTAQSFPQGQQAPGTSWLWH